MKPNQPTHSSAPPTSVSVSEWGGIASLPKPTRLPTTSAPTRAAMPELMCTTVPPAKSSAPHWKARPALAFTVANAASAACFLAASAPASAMALAAPTMASGPAQYQTMCAIGKYTNVTHSGMKSAIAENFMRSAIAPTISAGVMQAKVIWKQM